MITKIEDAIKCIQKDIEAGLPSMMEETLQLLPDWGVHLAMDSPAHQLQIEIPVPYRPNLSKKCDGLIRRSVLLE